MPKPIRFNEYDVIKPGLYPFAVESIDDDEGQFGPQLKWIFAMGGKAEGKKLFGWCSPVLTPKSKLYAWLQAIVPGVQIGKGFELDVADLVGRGGRMVVGVKQANDGIERNTIESMLPLDEEDEADEPEQEARGPAPTGLPPRQAVGAGAGRKTPF